MNMNYLKWCVVETMLLFLFLFIKFTWDYIKEIYVFEGKVTPH